MSRRRFARHVPPPVAKLRVPDSAKRKNLPVVRRKGARVAQLGFFDGDVVRRDTMVLEGADGAEGK